jgi:hypothetical protein
MAVSRQNMNWLSSISPAGSLRGHLGVSYRYHWLQSLAQCTESPPTSTNSRAWTHLLTWFTVGGPDGSSRVESMAENGRFLSSRTARQQQTRGRIWDSERISPHFDFMPITNCGITEVEFPRRCCFGFTGRVNLNGVWIRSCGRPLDMADNDERRLRSGRRKRS